MIVGMPGTHSTENQSVIRTDPVMLVEKLGFGRPNVQNGSETLLRRLNRKTKLTTP